MSAPGKAEKSHGKHPTQKPLALLERIIAASTKESDCVLDPFCGSATTGVAAVRMNRRFVGVELDSEYLMLGRKRYEAALTERESSALLASERSVSSTKSGKPTQARLFR
jgi:site-specific DNA-methyltransferase (adenine-specific)